MTDATTCTCRKPLINLAGICQICGLELLHIQPKTPLVIRHTDTEEAA